MSPLYNILMTQRLYALLIVVFAVIFISAPFFFSPVSAQGPGLFPGDKGPSGIVSCGDAGEQACNFCDLVKVANESLSFAVYFSVFIATLLFAYAGFLYVTSAGDTGKISTATGIFGKVVVGMIIILTAWLVVDTIMKTFFDNSDLARNFGPWNSIQCAPKENIGAEVQKNQAQIEVVKDQSPYFSFEVRRISDGTYEVTQSFSSLDQCKKEAARVDPEYGQVVTSCLGVDYEKQ